MPVRLQAFLIQNTVMSACCASFCLRVRMLLTTYLRSARMCHREPVLVPASCVCCLCVPLQVQPLCAPVHLCSPPSCAVDSCRERMQPLATQTPQPRRSLLVLMANSTPARTCRCSWPACSWSSRCVHCQPRAPVTEPCQPCESRGLETELADSSNLCARCACSCTHS